MYRHAMATARIAASDSERTRRWLSQGVPPLETAPVPEARDLEEGRLPQEAEAGRTPGTARGVLPESFRRYMYIGYAVFILGPIMLLLGLELGIRMLEGGAFNPGQHGLPLITWLFMAFILADIYQIIVISILNLLARGLGSQVPTEFKMHVCGSALAAFILFCLDLAVLYWIAQSTAALVVDERGDVFFAVTLFHLSISLCVHMNVVYLQDLLRSEDMARRLSRSKGAPEGALERNTETVEPNDGILEEAPQCAVCLQDFDLSGSYADGERILKTKLCRHVFHKECLERWLQQNRTCPLCRTDLGGFGQCTHGHTNPPLGTEGVTPLVASGSQSVPLASFDGVAEGLRAHAASQRISPASTGGNGQSIPPACPDGAMEGLRAYASGMRV
jgi:hypothetical protein